MPRCSIASKNNGCGLRLMALRIKQMMRQLEKSTLKSKKVAFATLKSMHSRNKCAETIPEKKCRSLKFNADAKSFIKDKLKDANRSAIWRYSSTVS